MNLSASLQTAISNEEVNGAVIEAERSRALGALG
jgi:hypothetical protein